MALILDRFRAGHLSAEVALMELLAETEDVDATAAAVAGEPALATLLADNVDGCARIVGMLRDGPDTAAPAPSVDAGLAFVRGLFDWSVARDETASVALYSLGNPEILAEATAEVVEAIASSCPLGPATRVVELGCGTGRFLAALAPRVASVQGLDLAPGMVAAARRRTVGLANVTVTPTDGRTLRPVADGSADLVLAVDVFPYLLQTGEPLVEAIVAEIARVLAPGGACALFQVSYAHDPDADRARVAGWAARHGLAVTAEVRLRRWSAPGFVLTRAPADTPRSSAPPR